MWTYEKKLEYPVNIKNTNPALAKLIISQYGGPDGELGASLRYLSQRFTMPYPELKAILTDIGTEELAPLRTDSPSVPFPSLCCRLSCRAHSYPACCHSSRQSVAQHHGRHRRQSTDGRVPLPRVALLPGILPLLRSRQTRVLDVNAHLRHQPSSPCHSLCHRPVFLLAMP